MLLPYFSRLAKRFHRIFPPMPPVFHSLSEFVGLDLGPRSCPLMQCALPAASKTNP